MFLLVKGLQVGVKAGMQTAKTVGKAGLKAGKKALTGSKRALGENTNNNWCYWRKGWKDFSFGNHTHQHQHRQKVLFHIKQRHH